MTALSATPLGDASAPRSRVGPWVEFLVVGGATPLLFALSALLRRFVDLDTAELAVGFTFFHLAYVVNDPHFAVTYLLFYEDFRERAFGRAFARGTRTRYWLAGVIAPVVLLVWGLGAASASSPEHLGLLLELMFLLVGWHYIKQGFGVMMVLSARRGIRFAPGERWLILAHGYCGWAFAWLNPHTEGRLAQEKGVIYYAVARPQVLEMIALGATVVTGVALVAMLVRKSRREGRLPSLSALLAFVCSVWCWLVFSSVDPLVRYMTPALHSLQYLYFVWLLKRNEATERTEEPYFEPPPRERLAVLAFLAVGLGVVLFHVAPEALDTWFAEPPDFGWALSIGPTPYFAALYAAVNIHHYAMDAVIWRRGNPRTRYLVA